MKKEVKIGIAFVLALIILYVGINFLKGINIFKPSNSYTVVFSDVTGLTLSSPVVLNGYQVGLVNSMVLDGSAANNIDVEVNLDKGIRIPKGSKIKLDVSIMGNANLVIEPDLTSAEYYTSSDKIPGTRSAGMLESVGAVVPDLQNLLPKVDSILSGINTLVGSPALSQSLENINAITGELSVASRQLNQLMTTLNKDLPQLSGNMTAVTEDLATVSGQFKSINIESTYRSLDSTMKNVQHLTDRLNSNQGSLGLLLNDRSLHDSLSTTLENASQLLQDVKENPSRYINVKVF